LRDVGLGGSGSTECSQERPISWTLRRSRVSNRLDKQISLQIQKRHSMTGYALVATDRQIGCVAANQLWVAAVPLTIPSTPYLRKCHRAGQPRYHRAQRQPQKTNSRTSPARRFSVSFWSGVNRALSLPKSGNVSWPISSNVYSYSLLTTWVYLGPRCSHATDTRAVPIRVSYLT
jgi:hypothetical protein